MTSTHNARHLNTSVETGSASLRFTDYERHDLIALMQLIVEGDPDALDELVSRRRPVMRHSRTISIPEWIEERANHQACQWVGGDEVPETARDLLYDRFTRLPVEPDGGIDCRYYYRGFLEHLQTLPETEVGRTSQSLQRNNAVIDRLTGYLHRHWRFCLREAWRRQQRMTVAHKFATATATLQLWVPASIPPRDRSDWISRNFGPLDRDIEGLRAKTQACINTWLDHTLREREQQLHASLQTDLFGGENTSFSIEHGWSHHGLAHTVAQEKANAPQRLRASIAAMSPEHIAQLVTRIFEDLVGGCYHPSTIAREFGLHKSTLTRFAASHWQPGDEGPTPDLWLNTAQVLAHQPQFAAALEEAGLYHLVKALSAPDHDAPP